MSGMWGRRARDGWRPAAQSGRSRVTAGGADWAAGRAGASLDMLCLRSPYICETLWGRPRTRSFKSRGKVLAGDIIWGSLKYFIGKYRMTITHSLTTAHTLCATETSSRTHTFFQGEHRDSEARWIPHPTQTH